MSKQSKNSIVDAWQLEDAKFDRLEQELINKGLLLPNEADCPVEQWWLQNKGNMPTIPNLVQSKSGHWVEPDVLAKTEPEEYKRITEDMVKKSRFYTPPKDSDDWDNGAD